MVFLAPWGSLLVSLVSATAEPAVVTTPGSPSSDDVCLLQFLNKGKYLKASTTPTDSGFMLVNRDHQCVSHKLDMGKQESLDDCYHRVKTADAQYFSYGKDSNSGDCFVALTTDASCPEGFISDFYDFYQITNDNTALVGVNAGSGTDSHISAGDTVSPSEVPGTVSPTEGPETVSDTVSPTEAPGTVSPTEGPGTVTVSPTEGPEVPATVSPTEGPAVPETPEPTASPTSSPTASPTAAATAAPTEAPTASPTAAATAAPTETPTGAPTAAPAESEGFEEVPVVMQLNVVRKKWRQMKENKEATLESFQSAFATHVGLEPAHVLVESTDPDIGESETTTDVSLLKTAEAEDDQSAAITLLVNLRVQVAEDRRHALDVKIASTKNSQAELDDLTDLVNEALLEKLPSNVKIDVLVTAINPAVATTTAQPTPQPTPKPTSKGAHVRHWTGKNPRPVDCCGENPIQGQASVGQCHEVGVDIPIRTGSTISLFDDNVQMSNVYKFYMETHCTATAQGEECTYVEISDPDFNHHNFEVGESKIKIQGFDIAGNKHECIKTLYVHDKEPPVFTTPEDQAAKTLIHHVSEESCTVKNNDPFASYEGLSFPSTASDNCDQDVEIAKYIYDLEGNLLYNSMVDDPAGDFTSGPGEYKMVYEAIDDYSFSLPAPVGGSKLTTNHTVQLILDDVDAPTEISHCPNDTTVFIEPNEH